ncbi:MAG TPA: NADH-quinone oxidoreductase subunit NuoN [Gammaproteobacteria bacterium]|jgi:NADH-quinone oxidoreductase subunit N|nr:NADH-quinone oxidoreductase subunit NuoN [Gammaproteobacteria bacterium]
MSFEFPQFLPAVPEMFLLGMICFILVVDVCISDAHRLVTYWLSLASVAGTAWLTVAVAQQGSLLTFSGMFVNDAMGNVLKLFTYLVVAVVFIYSRDYLRDRGLFKGEYYILGLTALLGMMIMISAHSMLTVYLGLELHSLSLYAMVALDRESPVASEAAMKYFVLGAIASGVLLYGMSLLYGATGTLDLTGLGVHIAAAPSASIATLFALGFVIAGLCFKLGAVPFHMWLPDVYEGSATSVTLFVGTAPKIAAFALFMRFLVEGLGGLHSDWQGMLIVISILSMAIGSFVAIAQSNLKRMLAYSTIGHVGFILLGILAGTTAGYQAAMFYTLTYVLMAMAAFGLILLLARKGFEAERLEDFKGLNERSPWFAAVMLMVMFGMAGVPPFVGFFAKLYVLRAVIDAGLTWLAVTAVVFSIISAYYYIRLVKLMYFDRAPANARTVRSEFDVRWLLSGNGLAILALGVLPGPLMALCARVIAF